MLVQKPYSTGEQREAKFDPRRCEPLPLEKQDPGDRSAGAQLAKAMERDRERAARQFNPRISAPVPKSSRDDLDRSKSP